MRRRDFVLAAGALGALRPAHVLAQPARRVTVAVLSTGTSSEDENLIAPFFAEMGRLGWKESQVIVYERYFSEGSRTRLAEVAVTAASWKPDLIYAPTGAAAAAARKATNSIPIVFTTNSDPIASGLIGTLSRPGGNATGVIHMGGEMISKRLELVREVLPRAQDIGVLLDKRSTDHAFQRRQHEDALRPKGLGIVIAEFSSFDEVPAILERFSKDKVMVVTMNPSFTLAANRPKLVALALRHRLALIGYRGEWALTGALFSYGADLAEAQRRSAEIVNRVLRGARPAETPVERASKFELVANLRTAKALGITLPKVFLARADRLVE
jgi:putative ABC transport system substrate-binding protein